VLPAWIESIGPAAFAKCAYLSRWSLRAPAVLATLGHSVFSHCSKLVDIDLGDTSLTSIVFSTLDLGLDF